MNNNLIQLQIRVPRTCPDCDAVAVQCRLENQEFEYGNGDEEVILHAVVPVWTCSNCLFSYTDGDAEEIRHEAVCKHLGIITPADILALRTRLGLTQKALAGLTHLGEASIKRWESGAFVQNASADMLLRLCQNQISRSIMQRIAEEKETHSTEPVFRTEITEAQVLESKQFQLRRAN